MSEDLYTLWLKIPEGVRPPDHYALLGLPRFCDDVNQIEEAAHQRLDALDRFALHPDLTKRDACQRIMNEVARARVVLIQPQKRSEYDRTLPPLPEAPKPAAVKPVVKPLANRAVTPTIAPLVMSPAAAPIELKPDEPPLEELEPEPDEPAVPAKMPAWTQPLLLGRVAGYPAWWLIPIAVVLLGGSLTAIWVVHSMHMAKIEVAVDDHSAPPPSTGSPATTSPLNPQPSVKPEDILPPGPVGPSTRVSVEGSPVVSVGVTPTPPVVTLPPTPPPKVVITPAPPVTHVDPPVPLPTPSVVRVARNPVPAASDLGGAWKLVDELFADDIANSKTPDAKAQVAKKMLALAAKTNDDPVGRYALLTKAGDLATQGGDPDTALSAIDAVSEHFEIDGLKVKGRALTAIAKSATPTHKPPKLAEEINAFLIEAVAADRYELAHDACAAAAAVAAETHDAAWAQEIYQELNQIDAASAEFQKTADARASLGKNIWDPTANFRVGSYRCFIKEDWTGGLPLLAIGSDSATKALALAELDRPIDVDKIVAIADAWWDLSERLPAFQHLHVEKHAVEMYGRILSKTTDAVRSRIRKRIDQVEASRRSP